MHSAAFRRAMALVVVAAALTAAAQTNFPPQFARWFILPERHLRTVFADSPVSGPDLQPARPGLNPATAEMGPADPKAQSPDQIVVTDDRGAEDVQQYYLRQRNFGFERIDRVPDNLLARALDSVFRPEEFHIGRTATFSCSLLTAIVRKNPFCLLNPIFLNVSW